MLYIAFSYPQKKLENNKISPLSSESHKKKNYKMCSKQWVLFLKAHIFLDCKSDAKYPMRSNR